MYSERSGSSDSPGKTYVVHMVLFIAITWRGVNEPTLETSLFSFSKKKPICTKLSGLYLYHVLITKWAYINYIRLFFLTNYYNIIVRINYTTNC